MANSKKIIMKYNNKTAIRTCYLTGSNTPPHGNHTRGMEFPSWDRRSPLGHSRIFGFMVGGFLAGFRLYSSLAVLFIPATFSYNDEDTYSHS
jgi:hypothetical protein